MDGQAFEDGQRRAIGLLCLRRPPEAPSRVGFGATCSRNARSAHHCTARTATGDVRFQERRSGESTSSPDDHTASSYGNDVMP